MTLSCLSLTAVELARIGQAGASARVAQAPRAQAKQAIACRRISAPLDPARFPA
ncbi:hypothetical protein ACU4GI_41710 [Cupriavidus basilensis]|uniref:hypothetical protein n=1 Tax=Cupriavidus basilensis TaxID=68895 RepID=UPI0023E8C789|nr:hypothetical protein [Cupriavidus basilensis]MDF3888264.1 hypothetical protein [Cupriavidus basilensis]